MEPLPDPSDWTSTCLAPLQAIDALLRCQVCKDFLTSAVITSCSHTFCSLCIRRCLAAESRCPACRAPEQEVKLRRNGAVQELVDVFVGSRDELLKVANEEAAAKQRIDEAEPEPTARRRSKRKRSVVEDDEDYEPVAEAPQTRSQRRTVSERRASKSNGSQAADVIYTTSDDERPKSRSKPGPFSTVEAEAPDGLVNCPICSKRMKPELVFGHLDSCSASSASKQPPQPSKPAPKPSNQPSPSRIPQLSYGILKETSLRAKLSALGIPAWGPRQLLIRRHTEWSNRWNANCDARYPKTRRELLRELDQWERTQGGNAPMSQGVGGGVMDKAFDGEGWMRKNKGQFEDLIGKARMGRGRVVGAKEGERMEGVIEGEVDHANAEHEQSGLVTEENTPDFDAPTISERPSESKVEEPTQPPQINLISPSEPPTASKIDTLTHNHADAQTAPPTNLTPPQPESFLKKAADGQVRKVPMFQVSSEPVLDADIGDAR